MHKVALYSGLLILGMILSQQLPLFSADMEKLVREVIQVFSMVCLSFIMIKVGYEFEIDKKNPKKYVKDYFVAMTAALFPWVFCVLYLMYFLSPEGTEPFSWENIKEASLLGRFASPTSAGVLFSMLIAAGLAKTWTYKKARILAIFDDLDTILLMIPLKMMIIGLQWQMLFYIVMMGWLLYVAWRYMDTFHIPSGWIATLVYGLIITFVSELTYYTTLMMDIVPIHIEVLLPAFVLGVVIFPSNYRNGKNGTESDEHIMSVIVSAFMLLVGLNMPSLKAIGIIGAGDGGELAYHVIVLSFIINIGKMFPLFCYKKEVHWKERLAVCIGMFPRGEVGAGILMLSLSYGIEGKMLAVSVLCLALNLILSGVFIWLVKSLLHKVKA